MFCPKCGDPVDTNEKFCNKCGYNLGNNNLNVDVALNNNLKSVNSNQTMSPNSNYSNQNINVNNNISPIIPNSYSNNFHPPNKAFKSKKCIFVGLGVGGAILAILILIISIKAKENDYYFSDVDYGNNDEIVEQKNDSNQQNNTKKTSKYRTVIITDNTYEGVSIKSSADAYDLISKDSVVQKNNCPTEIKEIEEEIINKYQITAVNLCELDVDFAKELVNVFEKVYTEYPEAKSYLTNLSLVNASLSDGYIAAFMPVFNFATSNTSNGYPWVIKTQVLLNTTYFLNKERLQASVTDGSNVGHFPPNSTIYSPVAHEFGHYLSFLALMKDYEVNSILLVDNNNVNKFYEIYSDFGSGDFSLEMIEEAYNNYKKDTNTSLSIDEWRGTISKYALAKDNSGNYIYDETIAESFHDVYLNGDNAKDASKYVVKVLKSRLGG